MSHQQGRHTHWFSCAAFATVALVGLLKEIGDVDDQKKEVKWAVSGISVVLGLSGLAVFANMILRDKFVGTHMEGGMAVLTFGMWAAVMPAIMDPGNEIATAGATGYVQNPNLYFFSWGSLLTSLFVLASFMREKFANDKVKGFHQLSNWIILTVTSLVVMVAGGRIFQEADCDESFPTGMKGTIRCDRIKFSVGLGAASAFFCMLWMAAAAFVSIPAMVDTFMSSLMLIAWTFGIAVITFGGETKAAAPFMGNLYFFTWGSFGLASRLVAADAFDMIGSFMGTEEEAAIEDKKAEQEEVAGDEEAGVEEAGVEEAGVEEEEAAKVE